MKLSVVFQRNPTKQKSCKNRKIPKTEKQKIYWDMDILNKET